MLDSYDLQRFLSDYRDLSAWIQSMMGLVASDELASDVTGAEALLERHQVVINFTLILVPFLLFLCDKLSSKYCKSKPVTPFINQLVKMQ